MATETEELERIADYIQLAYEDPDFYIRNMLSQHVLYVKWKRIALLQMG